MALNLPEMENIFPFSKERSQGLGSERIGQATIIVALDGTGDTSNIQEGVDMLPSGGGVVYVKEGTYNITSAIAISKNNIMIKGTGNGTKITTTSDITMINITGLGIQIADLYLYGDTTKGTNDGIYLNDTDGTWIMNCKIENCGRYGIKTNIGTYNLITECLIRTSEDSGIWMNGEGVWTIAECYINSCKGSGIYADSVQQLIIANNEIGFNLNYGIYATAGSWMRVTGNNITRNTYDGVKIESQNYGLISNNTISVNDYLGSTYSGIKLVTADDIVISNNVSWGNGTYGVDVSNAGCDRTIIMANKLLGNTAGEVNDSGTDTEIINKKEDIKLNELGNPEASKTFNLGNEKFLTFTSVDRTPVAGEGIFNWNASGNFTGDLCHIHQHTGNAGVGTVLLHLEGEDADITPFRISDGVPATIFNVDLSGNLTLAGTVDGIDIATDVAANTLKETNVTTNLSLGAGNATTEIVACSDGTDCTLIEADTDNAGLLGAAKWDEIVAATAHVADNTQAHSDYMLNTGDTATGDYTFDTTTLKIDAANNRVGIGIASPLAKLHISSPAGFTRVIKVGSGTVEVGEGSYIEFPTSTSDGYGAQIGGVRNVGGAGKGDLVILTGATAQQERVRVLDDGKVGIGTATPSEVLDVVGNAEINGNIIVTGLVDGIDIAARDHAEAHTLVSHSDTTGTGPELDELTDGSETILHSHAYFSGLSGSMHVAGPTQNEIFDALDASIPATNDEMLIDGAGEVEAAILTLSKAKRTGATTIDLYFIAGDGLGTYTITDGSATIDLDSLSISWPGGASAVTSLISGTGVDVSAATGDITLTSNDGEIVHDNLSGFEANEHLDWTTDRGATNIHAGNYTDTDTTAHASFSQLDYASAGHTGFAPALGADDNYVTDAEKIVVGNTSGTNTGDDTTHADGDGSDHADVAANTALLANKTSYWSCAGIAFRQFEDGDNFTQTGGRLDLQTGSTNQRTPVNLPQGAVVTACVVYGNDAGRTWTLNRANLSAGDTIAGMATAAFNTEDSSIANATIDNSTYTYYLHADCLSADEIDGARITYTTDYD